MPCQSGCAKCSALRAAALEIIARDGIAAVSPQALAAHSGMTPVELSAHYPTASVCLYDTYEEVSRAVLSDFAAAFAAASSWSEGLRRGGRALLARMSEQPAQARLCFVELLSAERELRRRRELSRRRMLELFASEHRRLERERLSQIQLELLIGAGFQAIAEQVARGAIAELPELEGELAELAGVFEPIAA